MHGSEIDVLLAQARDEGRFDSSGSFTVLLRQAQNHAGKDFARLYPGGYLLKAVQCAVAAGCQDVHIVCSRSRATVRMLGPGPSRVGGRLLEALRSPLSISKQDPLGHLAICILAALAQGASRVEWCCFDGLHGEMLAVTQETVDLKPLPTHQWKGKGKTGFALHVHRDASRLAPELHMLKSRCGYCPVSLFLNRKQMRGTAWLEYRSPAEKSRWFEDFVAPGFRVAERYLYKQKSPTPAQTLGLPAVDPLRYGLFDSGPVRAGWQPGGRKVFLGLELVPPRAPSGAIAWAIEMVGKSRINCLVRFL